MALRERLQDGGIEGPSIIQPISRPRDPHVVPAIKAPVLRNAVDPTEALSRASRAVETVFGERIKANQDAALLRADAFGVQQSSLDKIQKAVDELGAGSDPKSRLKAINKVLESEGIGSPAARLHALHGAGNQIANQSLVAITARAGVGHYATLGPEGEEQLAADVTDAITTALESGVLQSATARSAFELRAGLLTNEISRLNQTASEQKDKQDSEASAIGELVTGSPGAPGLKALGTTPIGGPEFAEVVKGLNVNFSENVTGFGLDPGTTIARGIRAGYDSQTTIEDKEQYLTALGNITIGGYSLGGEKGRTSIPVLETLAELERKFDVDQNKDQQERDVERDRAVRVIPSRLNAVARQGARGAEIGGGEEAAREAVLEDIKVFEVENKKMFDAMTTAELNNFVEDSVEFGVSSFRAEQSVATKRIDAAKFEQIRALKIEGRDDEARDIASSLETADFLEQADKLFAGGGGVEALTGQVYRNATSDLAKLATSTKNLGLGEEHAALNQELLSLASQASEIDDKAEATRFINAGVAAINQKKTGLAEKSAARSVEKAGYDLVINDISLSIAEREAAYKEKASKGLGTPEELATNQVLLNGVREQINKAQQEISREVAKEVENALLTSDKFLDLEKNNPDEFAAIIRDEIKKAADWTQEQITAGNLNSADSIRSLRGEAIQTYATETAKVRFPDTIGTRSPEQQTAREYSADRDKLLSFTALPDTNKAALLTTATDRATLALEQAGGGVEEGNRFAPTIALVGEVASGERDPKDATTVLGTAILSEADAKTRRALTTMVLLSAPQHVGPDLTHLSMNKLFHGGVGLTGMGGRPTKFAATLETLADLSPEMVTVREYIQTLDWARLKDADKVFRIDNDFAVTVHSRPSNFASKFLNRDSGVSISISLRIPDDLTVGPALVLPPSVIPSTIPVARQRQLLGSPAGVSDEDVKTLFIQTIKRGSHLLDR